MTPHQVDQQLLDAHAGIGYLNKSKIFTAPSGRRFTAWRTFSNRWQQSYIHTIFEVPLYIAEPDGTRKRYSSTKMHFRAAAKSDDIDAWEEI